MCMYSHSVRSVRHGVDTAFVIGIALKQYLQWNVFIYWKTFAFAVCTFLRFDWAPAIALLVWCVCTCISDRYDRKTSFSNAINAMKNYIVQQKMQTICEWNESITCVECIQHPANFTLKFMVHVCASRIAHTAQFLFRIKCTSISIRIVDVHSDASDNWMELEQDFLHIWK